MAIINMTIKKPKTPISIEHGNVSSKIIDVLPENIISIIDNSLSYFIEGYQYSKLFKSGYWDYSEKRFKYWDGKKHLLSKNQSFASGLIFRVKELLEMHNYTVSVIDRRTNTEFGPPLSINNLESREYQDRALNAALEHRSGIIKVATGGGKSAIISSLIAKTNTSTMVFVPSLDLLYQTRDFIENVIGKKIGIIGDGICEVKKITISTIWSAANALSKSAIKFDEEEHGRKEKFATKDKQKIAAAIEKTNMIIVDECHMTSCQSVQLINSAAKNCRYKFGFSGTPSRFSGEDLLIEGVFGRKIIDIPASELISEGFLVRPTIHFVNIPESSEDLGTNYHSIYKKYIIENDIRNDKIVEIAKTLHNADRKILILVKNIAHGNIIMDKIGNTMSAYFVRGELDAEERNRIKNSFIDGQIDLIVASAVYDQGIDIKNLDALILAGSGKSYGRAIQRIGRVIRPAQNKTNAVVVDFWDNAKYLTVHSKKRLEIYKTEDGFAIKLPKNFDAEEVQSKTQPAKRASTKNIKHGW